jgi:hypothetical protein
VNLIEFHRECMNRENRKDKNSNVCDHGEYSGVEKRLPRLRLWLQRVNIYPVRNTQKV